MAHWITDANKKRIKVAGNYGKLPDAELSATSENAVQNKVIAKAINNLKLHLLWENATPTVSMNTQTITVSNLSNYDTLCVLYKSNKASSVNSCGYAFGKNAIQHGINLTFIEDVYCGRFIIIRSNTTIEILEAYRGGTTIDNNVCVPVAIYGLNLEE